MSEADTIDKIIKTLNRDKLRLLSRELRPYRLVRLIVVIDNFIDELEHTKWEIEDAQEGKGGYRGSN